MTRIGKAGRQLSSFLWRASTREEVDADIAFHIDMLTQELEREGMPAGQARATSIMTKNNRHQGCTKNGAAIAAPFVITKSVS